MPIYEYHCQKCGTMEIMQRITEKALARCPNCKGKIKKLISHTSFQLKGTGWYLTDYARKDGPKEEKKSDGESKGESQPAAAKSSDDKTAAKPATASSKPAASSSSTE
jgi:putative FmdB family regulatory protein